MRIIYGMLLFTVFVGCGRPSQPSSSELFTLQPNVDFPTEPNSKLTPGSECENPTQLRYPEKIKYCHRDVSSDMKRNIISEYERKFGYNIADSRPEFKIDHYISLCMGGSNDRDNLWPQHSSVYELTDPIEQRLCDLLAQGSIRQAFAIETIKRAKNNLDQAPEILREIESGH